MKNSGILSVLCLVVIIAGCSTHFWIRKDPHTHFLQVHNLLDSRGHDVRINETALQEAGFTLIAIEGPAGVRRRAYSTIPEKASFVNTTDKDLCVPKLGADFDRFEYSLDFYKDGEAVWALSIGETFLRSPSGNLEKPIVDRLIYNDGVLREIQDRLSARREEMRRIRPGERLPVILDKFNYLGHDGIEGRLSTPGLYQLFFITAAFHCDALGSIEWRFLPEKDYILEVLADQQLGTGKLLAPSRWDKRRLSLMTVPGILFYHQITVEVTGEEDLGPQ